ncbi:MAG TPA: T9SS type A sorting domain-containing protein [Chitinophagaceae bacterium]|nr:T9SS type A sorting domain-containing protein [Chitinophagaceae bacterium]
MKKILLTVVASVSLFIAQAQWLPQNAGFTKDTLGFYEMSIPNKNTAWAVCFDIKCGLGCGRFIQDFTRTTDGGATWIPGKMGNDHTLDFSNISAIDENEAWVAMNKRYTGGGGLYHTIDGGITWEKSNPMEIFDENSFPNFVYFQDKNHGIAMGDPNGGYFEVYTTNNKGKKWKRVPEADLPPALPNEYGFVSGYAAVNNTIWFGTTRGRMYKSVDFGKTWTVNVVDPAGKFVNEIAFNDDMLHGVAHLRNNFGQTFLYSTADGGVTWTGLGQPANWKSSRITSVPGTNALISTGISGNPNFRGSAISYNNGTTWTEIERAVNKTVSRFYDATTGYACGAFLTGPPLRGGIFKSDIVFEETVTAKKILPEDLNELDAFAKVFPSPAKDVINILLQDQPVNSKNVINIMGMDGKLIETVRSTGSKLLQLNISSLVPGVYMLHIESNGRTGRKMIVVAR